MLDNSSFDSKVRLKLYYTLSESGIQRVANHTKSEKTEYDVINFCHGVIINLFLVSNSIFIAVSNFI